MSKAGSDRPPEGERILLLSDYSWVFLSYAIVRKRFPGQPITIGTTNVEGFTAESGLDAEVVELGRFRPGNLFANARRLGVGTRGVCAFDHGFGLNAASLILTRRFARIYLIEPGGAGTMRPIGRREFLRLLAAKLPYFLNKLAGRASQIAGLARNLGLPHELFIETTTICNLQCGGCATGLRKLHRPYQHISQALFAGFLEKNKPVFRYLDYIVPHVFGEPLLNKDIIGHIRALRGLAYPYTRIELHTNGNIREPSALIRELLTAGLDMVSVSIDGVDQAAYASYRKNGDLALVRGFVRELVRQRRELDLVRPEIVMQMVMTRYSQTQKEEALIFGKELGVDRVKLKPFSKELGGPGDRDAPDAPLQEESAAGAAKAKGRNGAPSCAWPYAGFVLFCDGKVSPCCMDCDGTALGGLEMAESSIKEVWNSQTYRRFRSDLRKRRIGLCNSCSFS